MLRLADRAPVAQVHLKQPARHLTLICLDCPAAPVHLEGLGSLEDLVHPEDPGCPAAPVHLVDPVSRGIRQDCLDCPAAPVHLEGLGGLEDLVHPEEPGCPDDLEVLGVLHPDPNYAVWQIVTELCRFPA